MRRDPCQSLPAPRRGARKPGVRNLRAVACAPASPGTNEGRTHSPFGGPGDADVVLPSLRAFGVAVPERPGAFSLEVF